MTLKIGSNDSWLIFITLLTGSAGKLKTAMLHLYCTWARGIKQEAGFFIVSMCTPSITGTPFLTAYPEMVFAGIEFKTAGC